MTRKTIQKVIRLGVVPLALGFFSSRYSLGQDANPATGSNWAVDNVDEVSRQNPNANIRINSTQRTVRRQAELMVDAANSDPDAFTRNYGNAGYAKRMVKWLDDHPDASRDEAAARFESMISAARAGHANVSDHLNDPQTSNRAAVDITVPRGDAASQDRIQREIAEQGGRVNRHEESGDHWHISYRRDERKSSNDGTDAAERINAATGGPQDACYADPAKNARYQFGDDDDRSRRSDRSPESARNGQETESGRNVGKESPDNADSSAKQDNRPGAENDADADRPDTAATEPSADADDSSGEPSTANPPVAASDDTSGNSDDDQVADDNNAPSSNSSPTTDVPVTPDYATESNDNGSSQPGPTSYASSNRAVVPTRSYRAASTFAPRLDRGFVPSYSQTPRHYNSHATDSADTSILEPAPFPTPSHSGPGSDAAIARNEAPRAAVGVRLQPASKSDVPSVSSYGYKNDDGTTTWWINGRETRIPSGANPKDYARGNSGSATRDQQTIDRNVASNRSPQATAGRGGNSVASATSRIASSNDGYRPSPRPTNGGINVSVASAQPAAKVASSSQPTPARTPNNTARGILDSGSGYTASRPSVTPSTPIISPSTSGRAGERAGLNLD